MNINLHTEIPDTHLSICGPSDLDETTCDLCPCNPVIFSVMWVLPLGPTHGEACLLRAENPRHKTELFPPHFTPAR